MAARRMLALGVLQSCVLINGEAEAFLGEGTAQVVGGGEALQQPLDGFGKGVVGGAAAGPESVAAMGWQ
ncbi:hypothetical protein D3C72_2196070 [compost metagenome]